MTEPVSAHYATESLDAVLCLRDTALLSPPRRDLYIALKPVTEPGGPRKWWHPWNQTWQHASLHHLCEPTRGEMLAVPLLKTR